MGYALRTVATLTPALTDLVKALPKVELHLHFEGAIVPEIALGLARRHGLRLPGDEQGVEGLRSSYRFADFRAFLKLYMAVCKCLVEAEDFVTAGRDIAARLAQQNIRYAEVTFTALTHLVRGVPQEVVIESLTEVRRYAAVEHGVALRWVFDIVRSFPEQSEPTADFVFAMEHADPGSVVGIGVGGPEAEHYAMAPIVAAFARVRAEGFKCLPHAGENSGAGSIWTALRELKADRIGHGVRCEEDPALVEYLREHQVPLEVCPSSNVALGVVASFAEHPLPRLIAGGLAVTLASDDPPLFGTDLEREYLRCAETFGWDAAQILATAQAGVRHSFAPQQLVRDLLDEQNLVAANAGASARIH